MRREQSPAEIISIGTPQRPKLGLALAGGGFRASLFHLGVLWRLAELDLLRYVELLSTVSGGSIVGALYALLLREKIQASPGGNLSLDDYVRLIETLCETLVRGIQRNLRTRLFWSPVALFRMLVTKYGMAHHMGTLYEKHLFGPVSPGMLLRGLITLPGKVLDLEAFNAARGKDSRITRLVLNATTLNSGAPFQLSSVEIGDPRLGYFRRDEIDSELMPRRFLLRMKSQELEAAVKSSTPLTFAGNPIPKHVVESVATWRTAVNHSDPLIGCELGALRRAKIAAWYHQRGPAKGITGGRNLAGHAAEFAAAVSAIDSTLTAANQGAMERVLEVYYLRSAEAVSASTATTFDELTLADAVAASAAFPPVFPPFRLPGFYDSNVVDFIGLTDGGVYDNAGVTTLLQEGCTHVIASDTGGMFNSKVASTVGRFNMVTRISSILMNALAEQQRSSIRDRNRVSEAIHNSPEATDLADLRSRFQLYGLAYFHIASPPLRTPRSHDPTTLGRMRTDLDAFGDVEVGALVNHGYETADDYLSAFFDVATFPMAPASFQLPVRLNGDAREARIIATGDQKFFRALHLKSAVTILAVLFGVGAVMLDAYYDWRGGRYLAALTDETIFVVPRRLLLMVGAVWSHLTPGYRAIALPLAVAAGAGISQLLYRMKRITRPWAGLSFFLLGAAPIWIAAAGSLSAVASYLFNGLPFLARTRLPAASRKW